MKLHEVLETAKPHDDWFRPVSMRGAGVAYCIDSGTICMVPTSRGALPAMTTAVSHLVDDWEIVTPDNVLSERP